MAMNDFNIGFIAGLDGTKSKAKLNQDIDAIKKSLNELELKAKLDPNQVKALENQLNSLKVNLNNVSIDKASLNNLVSQINNSLSGIKLQIPNLNTGNIGNQAQQTGQQIGQQIQNGINSVIQKGSFEKIFRASGNGINNVSKDAEKYFKTLSNTVSVQERLGTNNNLTSFTVSLKNAEGVAEQLNYQLRKITDDKGNIIDRYFEYSGGSINDNGVIKQLNTISAKADSLQTKLEKLKSSYSDMNASRPIKDSNNISALSQQYDKVAKSIENVRNADSASFSSMVSNAQREITVLENMVSQFRNAENVATQMKSVDISSGIAQAQERLGKLKANASGFDQMKQTIVDLDTAIANVGDKSSLDAFINKLKVAESQLGRVKAETKQLQDVNKIQLSYANGDYEAKVESTIAKTQQWRDENGNARISTEQLRTALANLGTAYNNLNANGGDTITNQKALKQAESELSAEIKRVTNEVTKMNAEYAKSSKVESLHQKLTEFYDKNSATHKKWGTELKQMMDATASGAKVANSELSRMELRYKQIGNEARQTGKLGLSFFDSIKEQAKKFTQWVSVASVVTKGVQTLREMKDAVVEVNSAMIELKKVSNASDNEIKNYFDEAAESAKRFGSSVSDMINATADWSRLGYNLPDSKQLAEVATLYKNVGDGIDIDSANQSLISTLQGFQLEAKDAMNIIDQFNEVANNFPIDSAGIGEALQRSAASLYAANTDLSKSIALITGTNAVVQDPSSVGNMWKTVSMRIRGTKQELEAAGEDVDGMVESTSKLRDIIKGLTGFDIMADEAGTQFKDVYDIVVGIGKEWKNLSDIEQAGLLEALAGKRQGNALSAALNNISMIENAYDTATNSAGSALKEQQEYEKGIQYSLDRLTASAQTFANHFLDSSLVKGIVDFGNTTINVIDKVTSALTPLGALALGGGIFAGIKNIGRPKMFGLYKYADINMCSLGY